jgi:O-antigen/teichoic acid export membrane protein
MPENIKKGTFLNFIAYSLSGLFLFLFNIITARVLGTEFYGIISVLWSSVIIVSRLLSTGIKDSSTRFIAHYDALHDRKGMSQCFSLHLKFTLTVIIFFFCSSLILYRYLTHVLFSGFSSLFWLFIIASIFYFLLLFLRGSLQGLRELKDSALSIIIEYTVMLISVLIFFKFFSQDIRLAGVSIMLAPLFSLFFILFLFPKHRKRFSPDRSSQPDSRTLLLFVVPTSFINFSSGFITALGPLFIKVLGDFSLAGIFAASLVLFKGARTVLTSLFISVFPHLSRQEALKNYGKLKRIIVSSLLFICIIFIILILISITYGQAIVVFIYGEEFSIERIHLFLMALFTGFFLLSELFNRVLLAKSMIRELTVSWICAFVILISILFIPLPPLLRVEMALLGAAFSAFVGMGISLLAGRRKDE